MLKRFETALLFALIFTIALSCVDFSYRCESIRGKVFRLHILANSNSEYDQSLKLKVRDRLLKTGLCVFDGTTNLSQAIVTANENLDSFTAVARDELLNNGCNLPVTACVEESYFNTRTYGGTTLPAGKYKALQIKIGKADGHNWWCVMYPSLCLPASEQTAQDVLDSDETDISSHKQRYIVKFKIVEVFEYISSLF